VRHMGSPSAPCLFVRAKDLLLSAAGGYVGCMTAAPGAQFEIKVDGIVRMHRDVRDTAIEAARFLVPPVDPIHSIRRAGR
jgi:hypothetical protein